MLPEARTGKPVREKPGRKNCKTGVEGGGETWMKIHPPHLQEGNREKAWCGN